MEELAPEEDDWEGVQVQGQRADGSNCHKPGVMLQVDKRRYPQCCHIAGPPEYCHSAGRYPRGHGQTPRSRARQSSVGRARQSSVGEVGPSE